MAEVATCTATAHVTCQEQNPSTCHANDAAGSHQIRHRRPYIYPRLSINMQRGTAISMCAANMLHCRHIYPHKGSRHGICSRPPLAVSPIIWRGMATNNHREQLDDMSEPNPTILVSATQEFLVCINDARRGCVYIHLVAFIYKLRKSFRPRRRTHDT